MLIEKAPSFLLTSRLVIFSCNNKNYNNILHKFFFDVFLKSKVSFHEKDKKLRYNWSIFHVIHCIAERESTISGMSRLHIFHIKSTIFSRPKIFVLLLIIWISMKRLKHLLILFLTQLNLFIQTVYLQRNFCHY